MKIEQARDAATPDEMRAEIFRLRFHDPMVRQVMDVADHNGLSSEDRYTMLAYHALRTLLAAHQSALDDTMTRPMAPMIMTVPNVQGQGRCAASSRSVPWTAGLGPCATRKSEVRKALVSFAENGCR